MYDLRQQMTGEQEQAEYHDWLDGLAARADAHEDEHETLSRTADGYFRELDDEDQAEADYLAREAEMQAIRRLTADYNSTLPPA